MDRANWLLLLLVAAAIMLVAAMVRSARRRGRALEILDAADEQFAELEPDLVVFPQRWKWVGPLIGLVAMVVLGGIVGLPLPIAAALGTLAGVLALLGEEYWAAERVARIEEQLAEAIDLTVSSLRAGLPLLAALESALAEARWPIRAELEDTVGRTRLGEDPRNVIRDLAMRVPLESFRLFCHALLVHWETGGSLAGTLTTIGRTIRDRIEVARRVRAQAVESQVSVVAVLAVTYGVAALMFKTNPDSLRDFMRNTAGAYIAAATIFLESIGILWIWRMSQIRF
ncbi:MAG: type II secretion system F family protein [Bryobacteraceae bacterium]